MIILSLPLALLLAPAALPVQARPVADEISGVVLEAESRRPLAGQPVRLSGGGIEPLVVETDADGRFAFERPRVEGGWLRLAAEPRPGWRGVEALSNVEQRPEGSRRELELLVRAAPTRVFSGRALHPGDDRPLAGLMLQISENGGPSEVLTTDARGAFTTSAEFAPGRLFATPVENDERGRSLRFDLGPAQDSGPRTEVALRFSLGQRLEVQVAPPLGRGLDELRAVPLPIGAHPAASWLPKGATLRAGVDGGPAWLRFTRCESTLGRPETRLYVYTPDGLLGGQSRAPVSAGVAAVELVPLGGVELTVHAPAGAPFAGEGVAVSFERLGSPEPIRFDTWVSPDRARRIAHLEPGRWLVSTGADAFTPTATEVEVSAGRLARVDLRPAERLASGTLTLRVVDGSGDVLDWTSWIDAPDVDAWVRSGDGSRMYTIETSAMCGNGVDAWFERVERDGRIVLEAQLGPVPLGDYRVQLRVAGRTFRGPDVARPGETAVYVLEGTVFGFRVRDAGTGMGVDNYRIEHLGRAGTGALSPIPLERLAPGEGVHARGVDFDELEDWCVVAPGYRRAYGGRSDFRPEAAGGWAAVALEPGFAVRLVARDAAGEWAVGVPLSFAGAEYALDQGGRALLASPVPPSDPRVSFTGWEVIAGDVGPDGRFDPAAHILRATLGRRP